MMSIEEIVRVIYDRLHTWSVVAVDMLPRLAVAIIVVFIFSLLSRLVRRTLVQVLTRISGDSSLGSLATTVARLVIMALGLFIALSVLGLDKAVTSLLAGAGVIALAVGFAFQDLTTNFISGTIIAIQRPIEVGDIVETNGFLGRVTTLKLRSVVLDNFAGQTIEIPSKDVFQKPIINYSRTGQRRLELNAGVSYIDDLEKTQRVVTEAVRKLPFLAPGRPVEVHFKAFGGDMIQFFVWFWVDLSANVALAQSEAIKAVRRAFVQNDLLMLFPPDTFDRKKRVQQEQNAPHDAGSATT